MSKLQDYREQSEVLAKRLSKCFMKRETNAMIHGDKVMADTLAAEIREIVDGIITAQDKLPSAIEDPSMMLEVIELLIGKKQPDNMATRRV